ncbi:MAG: DUF4175 family protein [Elusimicrobiota bacterium]
MQGELDRRIRRWRLERWRAQWAEGGLRFVSAAAIMLLAALLADRFAALPQAARWGLFAVGAAAAAAGIYLHFLRPLRLLAPARLLSDVARRCPQLAAYLRSAWELGRSGPSVHTSGELADEHLRRTDTLLARLSRGIMFSARPSRPAAKRTVFAAAAWGIAMPWLYNGQANFQRVLAPWQDARLDAQVEVRPGDRETAWAEPVEISARWRTAHINGPLRLFAREPGGRWGEVPWDREEGDSGSLRIDNLTGEFYYRVGYKDLRTRVYRLKPIPFPRLTGLTVSVHLPGRGPATRALDLEGEGEIAALRRSWVTLRGMPAGRVGTARLRVSYLSRPVEMKRLADGAWEGGFPLNENGTLKIDAASPEGSRDPQPTAYALRALDDAKPEVELLSPTFELEISRREKLTITYEARDDFGLRSLSFLYRVNGGAERVLPLAVFRRSVERHLGDFAWDLERLPVGSRVTFRVRVMDNASPHAQTAVSNEGVLHLVDFETVHAQTERMWKGAEEALRRLAQQEAEFGERLSGIRRDRESEDPAARERLRRALERLALEDAALAKEWADAVREMQDFARAMRQDPYANPGMTEAAEMLAKVLEAFRQQELPKAREEAAAGRYREAQEQHAALESRVRKAADLLSAGREMQSMQDFWGEAHRMDQAGGEIAGELERIAKSGKAPTAAEREKLQQALRQLQEQMDALSKTIQSMPKADPASETAKHRKIYHVPLHAARRTADALQAALERGDFAAAARIAQQLAQQLAQVREAVVKAAESAASGGQGELTERMEAAKRLWEDVIEQQSRSLQLVNALEDGKLAELAAAQKRLLEELAAAQRKVVAGAEERAAMITEPSLAAMRKVLGEFEASRVRDAPTLLKSLIASMKFRALRFPQRAGQPSPDAAALTGLAEQEQSILDALLGGAPPPPLTEPQLGDMIAASAVQRHARRKTAELDGEMRSIAEESGMLPAETLQSLAAAQQEQQAAEGALAQRGSAQARGHQQRALEHLTQGQKGMDEALSQQTAIQQGSTRPFGQPRGIVRPVGRGGRAGSHKGFVPLPGADDYQPPREIRREIERSLKERRPRVFDQTINEYLKRMSR